MFLLPWVSLAPAWRSRPIDAAVQVSAEAGGDPIQGRVACKPGTRLALATWCAHMHACPRQLSGPPYQAHPVGSCCLSDPTVCQSLLSNPPKLAPPVGSSLLVGSSLSRSSRQLLPSSDPAVNPILPSFGPSPPQFGPS
eukprot:722609-Pyramimonas_sp.AAC.1